MNQPSMTMNRPRLFLTQAAFAALCLVTGSAHALGLGRLQVQSALGETLRAEIDVTSLTAEEAASLRVRVAPPDVYRSQGLDYNAVLSGTRVELVRRGDRAVLRVTSDRAVQEPFVDLLLDVRWSTGRLNREFTMLFDPPGPGSSAPVAAPTAPVVSAPAPATSSLPPATMAPAPAPRPVAPRATAPADSDGSVVVRSGETLSRIGERHRHEGVSLDQMLAALYRENPNAFLGSNINLLKSGARLRLPSRDTTAAITPSEARSLVRAHSSNFDAVRQGLATAAPQLPAQSERSAKGQVQAQVAEARSATPGGDRLTLSKPSSPAPAASVAALNQNVQDLKKLADAARQEAAPAAPVAAAASVAQAGASTPAAAASAMAVPASLPAALPASVAKPAPAAAPAPEPEASPFDWLFSPLGGALGVGILVLVAGVGLRFARRRPGATAQETLFGESRLQPDSFFGVTGGQRVDTRDGASGVSSMSYSLSQLDAHGDVDPVAEADVYLAYGRDLQAEEILKEALRAQPERLAIRLKLLEVYAKRRDVRGFEQLAIQLYADSKGEGEDWEKAQAMGLTIDPDNKLYQPGGAPPSLLAEDGPGISDPLNATTLAQTMPMAAPAPMAAPEPDAGPPSLIDLDLELPEPTSNERTQAVKAVPQAAAPMEMDLDLADAGPSTVPKPASEDNGLNFDLSDLGGLEATTARTPLDEGSTQNMGLSAPGQVGGDSLIDAMQDLAGDEGDPMQRQLELAEEFRQIGDTEGARDVLQELINQVGSGPLVERAKAMLEQLR